MIAKSTKSARRGILQLQMMSMKNIIKFSLCILFGLQILTACTPISVPATSTMAPSAPPQATVETKTLPTSISPNQMIVYHDLQVTMNLTEITESYITEYGSSREPTAGIKFLWTHLILKNIGQKEQSLPIEEHFSTLFGTTEFKPTYGHRKNYIDYITLNTIIDQDEEVDAWLRFDIPADAELKDLTFAFLPDSTQVSFGFSSSDYFWADHPIYLWNCAP